MQGRRHGFESGGLLFGQWGTEYCLDIAISQPNSYVCFRADWQWC